MIGQTPGKMHYVYCACGGRAGDHLTHAAAARFEDRFRAEHDGPNCREIGKEDWERLQRGEPIAAPAGPPRPRPMNAITIWRPWALWIVSGIKTIETRRHGLFRFTVGQRLAIHAGQAVDEQAWDMAEKATGERPGPDVGEMGVVGVARVVEARRLTDADNKAAMCMAKGLFGLFLAERKRITPAIPCKGQQGIWQLPENMAEKVREAIG